MNSNNIFQKMDAAGMSMRQLAADTRLHRTILVDGLNKSLPVTVKTVSKIAKALNIPPYEISEWKKSTKLVAA